MQQNAERLNEPFRHFTATPYTGLFGAEISDIDLNAIDDANYTQINLLALLSGLRRLLCLPPRLPPRKPF